HLPKRKKIMLIEEKNADVITF
ncbi:TPA: helix-turn-helix domain-containing protein, partial [Enterococcus faecium]|nr:helix-turn-helix domain-containing protein [Enterococcus faecium]